MITCFAEKYENFGKKENDSYEDDNYETKPKQLVILFWIRDSQKCRFIYKLII